MNLRQSSILVVTVVLTAAAVALSAQGAATPKTQTPATATRAAAQKALPTPASVFGFEPGTDNKLATYDQSVTYFNLLAEAASKNMVIREAGKTTKGRTYIFALISSAENIAKIDRLREIAITLAHPAGLTDAQARALAKEGKAFVHIDGGLHATESAGPQQTPLLAYDILRQKDDPKFKTILDNCVLMLWPTINPDGQQLVAETWMKSQTSPQELYQEYVGHDNNRDAYMMNMIESRVIEHAWRAWEPNIIYVHHQSSPFPTRIWLPPFAAPIATDAPPIISSELNSIGMAIGQMLDEEGKPGATHMGDGFDAWYPGYIDYLPVFKNIPAFWTETQGTGPAPRTSTPQQIPANMRIAQPLYPSPWMGTEWHLRDAMAYQETASIATLDWAAKYKENLLMNRYRSGRDQIARGTKEAPYAYVFPQDQRDPVAPVELLRRLAFSGVRVSQATAPVTIDGTSYPAGTWVVLTDQEFAALAREVLDTQVYPDLRESPNGPLDQPYDAAGWTLPFTFGVKMAVAKTPLGDDVRRNLKVLGPLPDPKARPTTYNMTAASKTTDAAPFDSVPGIGFDSSAAAKAIVPPAGSVKGTIGPNDGLGLDPAENNTFKAIYQAWKMGGAVRYMEPGTSAARYIVTGLSAAQQDQLVKSLALNAHQITPTGVVVKKPRIGLYNPPSSMDAGWTRWVLEQYGIEYTPILPAEFPGTGALKDRFDVILLADDGGAAFGGGGGRGGRGAASAPVGASASQGQADRAKAVSDFVSGGGTLVTFNRASMQAATALKFPITSATAGKPRSEFFVGGSVLRIITDQNQRVMAGMDTEAGIFFDSGPIFDVQPGFNATVLAKYQDTGSPLMSGYLLGEKYLNGKAAALDVPLGSGHVVMLGFRPQWRGQTMGAFKIIFNALLSGK
jgi:hypothetical protein